MATSVPGGELLKISSLARESGVSKELIHHYLREGLLPRPSRPARYSERHLKLLRLVKRLRDERFLPLPVIREIMEFNGHDPDRIELVLLSGSEMTATAGVAAEPSLADSERLTIEEIHARTGVPREVIEAYASLGLIRPIDPTASGQFSRHDANLVSLVHRGTQMGIPIDSFRTIRSYIEVAFELEHMLFLPGADARLDLTELAREFAARREIANGFVLNVLTDLVNGQLHRFLHETHKQARAIGAAVYQPSAAFLRKHGIEDEIEKLRGRLGRGRPATPTLLCLMRLFFFGGRHREAVFTAEQALGALEGEPEAERILGYSLVLAGESDRGLSLLARARQSHPGDPVTTVYLAAARFHKLSAAAPVEASLRAIQEVTELCDAALAELHSRTPPADLAEVRLTCGWIFTSLPLLCERYDRGRKALDAVHRAASSSADPTIAPDALRLRFRIASGALLYRALGRSDLPPRPDAGEIASRREALKLEVLTLDPASETALRLFLEADGPPDARKES